ncbi:MAG TPA: asparagine synthase (glutamine-hydrolyzing) [Bryobacteraceae bacterium]|nr:asparagine synthase (glutamine-hydrolyzing) [Bryobacteraceae bacterium]
MCGIAGQFLWRGTAQLSEIGGMCDLMRHRGPDHQGFHVEGRCAIGMRRLSITDVAGGQQPMSNEDGTVWTVFNGEIYNHNELRAELTARGHKFKTRCDTEVLVHLYEQEGVNGIGKLRGMFAYAIWDSRANTLLLVRDRLGKKPLYYAALPDGLYFASELKSLRRAGVPMDLDREALQLYFLLNFIPDPWSPYRAIRKLPAGGWIRYRADGRTEEGRYWKLPRPAEHPEPGLNERNACEQLTRTFDDAVRVRLAADVPVGAFLSGGIDSGSVVASMARQLGRAFKTFSIGFDEPAFNELPLAAATARKWNTDHHEIIVRPDAAALAPKLVAHFDEPFGDSSAIPTYVLSEFASRHVKVAVSGDGGDELFAGYDIFRKIQRWRNLDRVPQRLRRAISKVADALPHSAYGKNYLRLISRSSPLERYFESDSPQFVYGSLLAPEWAPPADAGFLARQLAHCLPGNGADVLTQALYFETTARLTGDMLVKVDRMSMAHSLEVRCPLLDHHLVELAAAIPHAWKIRNGRGKDIFIRALGHRLPPEILRQPKRGFGVPLGRWMRGQLRNLLWDHLTGATFLNRGIVTPSFVRHLLAEHDRGRRDHSHRLWSLLMLELWFSQAHTQSSKPQEEISLALTA